MNNSLKFSSFISFIAIVVVLLTSVSTQNAHAQFGLFDTVWTANNYESPWIDRIIKSNNDSLIFLYRKTDSNIVLVNTLNITQILWERPYSHFTLPYKFINNDNSMLLLERDLNASKAHLKIRDTKTFEVLDSLNYNAINFPYNNCTIQNLGISEIDTSIYYWGYCGATDIKACTYKVNYRTGQVKETSNILPYFAMTISEDGQYVAGVYYTGGGGTNVPYNEVIEVRKISDYSVVFRKESKYCDWTPSFTPYQWVSGYKFKFSKDNKFLVLDILGTFDVYNLENKMQIFTQKPDTFLSARRIISFTKNSKDLFYLYYTSKDGSINKVEYILLNLENLKQKTFNFSTESEVLEGGDGGLLFDDKYILSETTRIFDKNYQNRKKYNMSLAKLNFDLNSIQEPENPIQGTLYPNPTNNSINLTIDLQIPIQLNYSIFSETGQIVKSLLNELTNPGTITKTFDVSDLPTGIYLLRITGERFSQIYKVIIMR